MTSVLLASWLLPAQSPHKVVEDHWKGVLANIPIYSMLTCINIKHKFVTADQAMDQSIIG